MPIKQLLTTILLVVITFGIIVPATPIVDAQTQTQTTQLSITNVSLSTERPAPGERVIITPTIQNLDTSPSRVVIDSISLHLITEDDTYELTRVNNLGSIIPGQDLQIPLTHTFEETGPKDLRIRIFARTPDDTGIRLRYPVTLTVRETTHPQLDIDADDPVAGTETTVNVTLANGLDTTVRNVRLNLTGSQFQFEKDQRILAKLNEGDTTTFDFTVIPQQAGSQSLQATLTYRMPDGTTRTVTEDLNFRVTELSEQVTVEARPITTGDSPGVAVEVLNLGNTAIEDVVVRGESPNATVSQTILGTVSASNSKTIRLNVTDLTGKETSIDVLASYEIGTRERTVRTQTTMTGALGQVELTGVNIERDFRSGAIHITGSASNVGLTDTQGVVVRVQDSSMVSPSYPTKEYFVGEVPASDFAAFDVYASLDQRPPPGESVMIPVEVSYLVNGERQTKTVQLQYELPPPRTPSERNRGGPLPFGLSLPMVAGVVVVLILVGGYLRWR